MSTVEKIAAAFTVPVSMLEDFPAVSHRYVQQLMVRDLGRKFTADIFGESWFGPAGEMQRLEVGRVFAWDRTDWEDDDEEDCW